MGLKYQAECGAAPSTVSGTRETGWVRGVRFVFLCSLLCFKGRRLGLMVSLGFAWVRGVRELNGLVFSGYGILGCWVESLEFQKPPLKPTSLAVGSLRRRS